MSIEARYIAERLSKPQRDLLIRHVDGGAFVPAVVAVDDRKTMNVLLNAGLLRYHSSAARSPSRQAKTWTTDLGREVLCHVLADYAEALVRAGGLMLPALLQKETGPAAAEPVQNVESSPAG